MPPQLQKVQATKDQMFWTSAVHLRELQRKAEAYDREQQLREGLTSPANSDQAGRMACDQERLPSTRLSDALDPNNPSTIPIVPYLPENAPAQATLEGLRMSNPLTSEKSTFITDASGTQRYLGHSSTWSFSQWVFNTIKDHLGEPKSPGILISFDASAYELEWGNCREPALSDTSGLPSVDYAIYLTNTVIFHIGHLFYLFDEAGFIRELYEFHEKPSEKVRTSKMWYIQYLLILAFGKAFLERPAKSTAPPGSKYFIQAMNLLPNTEAMYREPILAIEILCMVSLYLQSVDMRRSAYSYIGHALRMALTRGLHREMSVEYFSPQDLERGRNIWWTVYILDRKFSSLMGNPPSIRDQDVTIQLPPQTNGRQTAATLGVHVELSRLIAQVINSIYAVDGSLDTTFLRAIQLLLPSMASLAERHQNVLRIRLTCPGGKVSRVTASLNLSYHQCIILAIRPLLLCLLQKRLDTLNLPAPPRILADPIQSLLQTCIESATEILRTLLALQEEGLLEHFLPFDLESTFSSAFVLIVASVILPSSFCGQVMVGDRKCKDAAFFILDDMIYRGSVPAKHRKVDLEQLDGMVTSVLQKEQQHSSNRRMTETINSDAGPQDFDDLSTGGSSMEHIQPGWQLSWTNQNVSNYPAQIDSIAQTLASYNGGASLDDVSIDQWLWNDTDPAMGI